MREVKITELINEAKILIGDGENFEYTRGILELISSFINDDEELDHAERVISLGRKIGLSNNVNSELY
jgi:hypothetical protein